MTVEVGPHGDHDAQPAGRITGCEQLLDESGTFFRIGAQGEDFLELVDDDDVSPSPSAGSKARVWVLDG
ncbi:hypothetical protein GPA10_12445 [Streptomyces sp. p1417]|uniref:Uncharacterized protein n=1 Tax=Streptomyces typhae TaxID=2681492 RepID=A0A6L6WTN5_9ACTN|nr:hypothetical protein [Streptomyces typhae]